jgi:Ca-activated chloride channel family protein
LRLADSERAQAARRRVSVLCIDAAPNSFLAMALAERGGGIAKFLTSSPEEEDITTALDEVLADWSRPVLAGLRLEVSRPEGEAAGRDALPGNDMGWGWSAVDLGDLPAGRAVWVAGRVPRGDAPDLSFRLAAGSRKLSACRLPLAGSPSQPSLKALFGARRVLGLETLIHGGYEKDELRAQLERLGYDPDRALESDGSGKSVYAENAREETKAALRGLLVKEALAYGLASAETAFIAARKERGQPVEGTVAVANALPAGWSGAFAAGMASGGGGALYRLAASAMPIPPPPSAMPGPLYAANIAAASAVPPDADDLAYEVPAFLPARRSVRSAGPPEVKVKKEVAPLFSGVPGLENGEAVLFDSSRKEDEDALPKEATFSRLRLRFPAGAPSAASVDADLYLLLYVGDLASPRARVRLRDLVKQGGERPVNLVRRAGEVVRIVLADPRGAWASGAPEIEVVLQ